MNLNKSLLAIFAILLVEYGYSQGSVAPKYSNEFLQIGVSADALGMSNAVVAKTNTVHSGYWNPAGLSDLDSGFHIGAMHSEYFAGIAKYDYVSIAKKIDAKSSFGFSVIRFAVDDIPNTTQLIDNQGNIDYDRITTFTAGDYAFLFSYGRKLSVPGLSVGGNFKVIYRQIGKFAKAWGFGLDGGLQYKLNDHFKFGLMMRDVTSTFNAWIFNLTPQMQQTFINTGNELPQNGLELTLPRVILGAHVQYPLGKKGFFIGGEIDLPITTDGRRNTIIQSKALSIDPCVGLEVGFREYVTIRAGVGNMQYIKNFNDTKSLTLQPNIGISVGIKYVTLDYAFTDIGDVSTALYSHVISLRARIVKSNKTKQAKL
ncbi:MAG TPA: PorV/PorQ family protein [Crocinitomicaceae bacterium]|nr:PorV/PorQ family protein [Crocinitomicaceae bacterium]